MWHTRCLTTRARPYVGGSLFLGCTPLGLLVDFMLMCCTSRYMPTWYSEVLRSRARLRTPGAPDPMPLDSMSSSGRGETVDVGRTGSACSMPMVPLVPQWQTITVKIWISQRATPMSTPKHFPCSADPMYRGLVASSCHLPQDVLSML